jgi:hypothetical protein
LGAADTGGNVSVGAAFIQNIGWVFLKSGLSRDVYVIGIHHRPDDPCSSGAGVVVLVCVLFSALWRRRKRSYSKNSMKLERVQTVEDRCKIMCQVLLITNKLVYRKFCSFFISKLIVTNYIRIDRLVLKI